MSDLILTPNWAWHEHYNDSGKRIVWLDALDVPLAHGLGTVFAQHGNPNDFPADLTTMPDTAFAAAGLVARAAEVETTPFVADEGVDLFLDLLDVLPVLLESFNQT